MAEPIKILITGAGGAGTIAIIKSLKWIGGYEIIACDANQYAQGLSLAHKRYVIPTGNTEDFLPKMKSIISDEAPNYIIPLVDEEIMKLWSLKGYWHHPFKMLTPSALFCAIHLDKYMTHLELKKHGLPTPTTILAKRDEYSVRMPTILKMRHSHGSKQAFYVNANEPIDPVGNQFIIQERIFGIEYTVSVVCSLDNELLAVIPKEVIDKRGITMIGVTRNVTEIEEVCKQIVNKMNPMGPFNVQLMMDKNGLPWIFEINPRYSTTVALTIASGINEVDAVIKRAEGRSYKKEFEFIPNMMMNRYYTQDFIRQ